jgi:ubiquinone/menaquinone biosynthesis C-methylase UbiE
LNAVSISDRDKFAGMVGIKENQIILETGCGEGGFTVALARHVKSGFVASADAVRCWAEKAKDSAKSGGVFQNVDILVADGSALPFKNNVFDVATSYRFVSEIREPRVALEIFREIRRVLKTRQRIVIFDNSFSPKNQAQKTRLEFGILWNEFLKKAGEYSWTQEPKPKDLTKLLLKSGFENIQVRFVEREDKIDFQKQKEGDEALLDEVRNKITDAEVRSFKKQLKEMWKLVYETGMEYCPAIYASAEK